MRIALTDETFARLLDRLDPDRERAADRYEELRRILVRFFEWGGAPFPQEHADETFDRVSRKLAEGIAIENIGGYSYRVARLVLLETRKGPESRWTPLEANSGVAATATPSETAAKEMRLACLDDCLRELPDQSRDLIIGYYQDHQHGRIEGRRKLAERLGLRGVALANRAQRLRDRLERCVTVCVARTST
jgi:DNA-directed RNA polymerase specialized sigma24 family protein